MPYLAHDKRHVARARARFRFDRSLTHLVRSRLIDRYISNLCTHQSCIDTIHSREHGLLHCPMFDVERHRCVHDLTLLDFSISFDLSFMLGASLHSDKSIQSSIFDVTGRYLVYVDSVLDN